MCYVCMCLLELRLVINYTNMPGILEFQKTEWSRVRGKGDVNGFVPITTEPGSPC